MPKYLTAILALTLILLFSTTVVGAPAIDTWYSIEDEEPYFSGSYQSIPDRSATGFAGQYYGNDFLFLTGLSMAGPEDSRATIRGSYIFEDLGLFIGLGYSSNGSASSYLISPGYRWAIDDRSYLALSLEYSDGAIENLALRAKYRANLMKLLGRLNIHNGHDPSLDLELAYQLREELVIGGDLAINGPAVSFSAGATWKPGSAVLDVSVDSDGEYAVSGVYYFGDLGIGADCIGEIYSIKAKYDAGDWYLTLGYKPEQDPAPGQYLASFTLTF